MTHPPRGAQLARNVGCQTQIALGIQPAGLDIRRQLAHRFGERRENLLDLARSEPPFPGHARRLPGCSAERLVQRPQNTEGSVAPPLADPYVKLTSEAVRQ